MIASVQAEAPHTLYEQTVRNRLQALLTDSPEWLQALRLRALSRFEALGFPTRRQEAWKYINIRPLLSQAFQPYTDSVPLSSEAIQPHVLGSETSDVLRLVFVNGHFRQELSSSAALEQGIRVDSLKKIATQEPELLKAHLAQHLAEDADAFVALNTALFEDGVFVQIPDGLVLQPLVQVLFLSTGNTEPRASYVRNLVLVGKGAKVSLALEYVGLMDKPYLNNSVNELVLADGAQADATVLFSESNSSWHFAATRSYLAASARLNLSTVMLTGGVARHTVQSLLQGEKADVQLNGLDVMRGQTEVYHHTVTEHWLPNCTSNQFYKGILDDQSKSEFNGMVFVAPEANGTDSQQLNKNLLLSDDARVWTRPQLQINADDVKCAHGATVGQLEKEQLFYLASRGLDKALAQSVLTYGFAEDIINRVDNPLLRQYLDARVLDNLRSSSPILRRQLGA